MAEKLYFYLLILCGIWSQEIIETVGNEIEKSSDFLHRQKRVISCVPGEDRTTLIYDVPYVAFIRHHRRINCVGSILSHHVVITIAECVQYEATDYEVFSNSQRLDHGNPHNVTDIRKHFGGHPYRPTDGIALLTIDPPIVYGVRSHFIELHSEPLLSGTTAVISGWGYNFRAVDTGTRLPRNLRKITVTIMNHRDCVNRYRPHNIQISDTDVCTFDPQRHCGHLDGGAPLVVDGYLAGVRLWTGPNRTQNNPEYPDVFAVLQHSQYNQWIRTNVHNIEAHL